MDDKDDVEYNRLKNEQLSRIEKIYSDGAIVTSILLIYLITCVGSLCGVYQYVLSHEAVPCLLVALVSVLSMVLFLFPILLCYTFALKSKEMMDSIINLSIFIKEYHEHPVLESGEIRGKKWETLHKNTTLPAILCERKEYYFLSLLSLILLVICGIVDAYLTIRLKLGPACLSIAILVNVVAAILSVIFIRKIRHSTGLNDVAAELDSAELFYKKQKFFLGTAENAEDLESKICEFGKENLTFQIFLMKSLIPHYKAIELEKLFYDQEYNDQDRIVKRFAKKAYKAEKRAQKQAKKEAKKKAKKKAPKDQKEIIKAYLDKKMKEYQDKYLR